MTDIRSPEKRRQIMAAVRQSGTEPELALWSKRIPPELESDVRVIARQPRERVAAFIELADFLALPRGRTENVPLKLFEYMAAGKAVVAARMPKKKLSVRAVLNRD